VASFLPVFLTITCTQPSSPISCYTPRPSHNSNYTWRRVQITEVLFMQFSPPSRHSIPYFPLQHPVLKHPDLYFNKCFGLFAIIFLRNITQPPVLWIWVLFPPGQSNVSVELALTSGSSLFHTSSCGTHTTLHFTPIFFSTPATYVILRTVVLERLGTYTLLKFPFLNVWEPTPPQIPVLERLGTYTLLAFPNVAHGLPVLFHNTFSPCGHTA
jgi:hypothetical protein